MSPVPIFDGHNDVLLRLWMKKNGREARDFIEGDGEGQIDLPRLKAGCVAGGLFAVFAPGHRTDFTSASKSLNPPPETAITRESAAASTTAMFDLAHAIAAQAPDEFRLCLTAGDIEQAMARGQVAAVLHIEGAEAIAENLDGLEALYERGLRSIGPVWSRTNVFGVGVPFRFPSSPDVGGGLTVAGIALVKACDAMRILVDTSHITEKGFWDVAEHSRGPLIASHSNVHAIAPSSRNLTDGQLRAIGERGGIAGLNFATGFLREDGSWRKDTQPEIMLRHLDHMLKLAGEDCVALGSDFDGAQVPGFIGDAGGSQALIEAMRAHGYGEALIAKIARENWLRVLRQVLGG